MKGWIEVEKCPLCGAEKQGYWLQNVSSDAVVQPFGPFEMPYAYRAVFFRCAKCGFSYQNPTMTSDLMTYYYESGLYRAKTGQLVENLDANEKQRGERIIKSLKALGISPKNMLDVGCSRGYLLDMARKEFECAVEGCDLNDKYCAFDNIVVYKNLKDAGLYDTITAIHVLEHQTGPVGFLQQMKEHLADGGKLVVEVPFLDGPYRLPHPVVFEPHTLNLAMKLAGFKVETAILQPHLLVVAVKA